MKALFNTMLNRTRRRDIQDFCVRRPRTVSVEYTDYQRMLHDELLSFERQTLSMLHDNRTVPFMMSTIRRQAASCIFGLAPHIRDIIGRRIQLCFCQMCHRVKPHKLMEVNNIELLPQYYFPQLRIALCLECSKRYESLRNNATIRDEYLETIKKASIQNQGTVDIQIGHEDTITFTAKHLAEIQEILRQMPNRKE